MRRSLSSQLLLAATVLAVVVPWLFILFRPAPAEEDLYARGLELYRQGASQEALETFLRARERRDTPELGVRIGWCHLRLGNLDKATREFQKALESQPRQVEARTGLGYVALRRDRATEAAEHFSQALAREPGNADALAGAGLAARRLGHLREARSFFERALAREPGHEEARRNLAALPPVPSPRPPLVRPSATQMPFRAGRNYFEVGRDGRWEPIFVQGVNLGAALPGRFPAEFPQDKALYAGWLADLSDLGANVVRLYTILPPSFYEALRDHNTSNRPPLYLVQGVWTELPEDHDYQGAAFETGFQREVERAVDVVHGRADLEERRGHASGHYAADVSPWTLALLLGREWEPDSVEAFNALRPGLTFAGRYLRMPEGNAMEAWLAEQCDHAIAYEMDRYNAQRPVSFTSWPTLDPLHHVTETTKAEESALLARQGRKPGRQVREYDNDGVSASISRFQRTEAFPAGVFASYHAYPYYPDFMVLDEGYAKARSSRGPSSYFGYLEALKKHYGDLPVLIAEYGVPSSRGVAHLQPQGWHHGGHTEREQGEIDARLTRELWEAGCAGGILFAWIDEWFKKNWVVIDVERPLDRNPLWFNALDAEQNYGLRAMRPGPAGQGVRLQGDPSQWKGARLLARKPGGRLRALSARHDEGWLYLRLDVDGPIDFSKESLLVMIDSYAPSLGDHKLPLGLEGETRDGMEFALLLAGERSELLVAESYRPFVPSPEGDAWVRNPAMASRSVRSGRFVPLVVETNRQRLSRTGKVYPAMRSEWGRLREGSLDPAAPDYDTRADWHARDGMVEVRLPWGLLNVTDPSSRQVVHTLGSDELTTRTTEGMRFLALDFEPGSKRVLDTLPASTGALESSEPYTWRGWEEPTWHTELKESYRIVQREFRALGGRPPEVER